MQQSIEAITQSILQGSQLKRGDDCRFFSKPICRSFARKPIVCDSTFVAIRWTCVLSSMAKAADAVRTANSVLSPPTIIPAAPNMDFWMWIRLR